MKPGPDSLPDPIDIKYIWRLMVTNHKVFKYRKLLKIGIHKDLYEKYPEISHRKMSRFLHAWTQQKIYQGKLANKKNRYDLDCKKVVVPKEEKKPKIVIKKKKMVDLI